MPRARLLAALAAIAALSAAADYRAGDLEIGDPYALATPPAARAGAGYLTITNAGATPDRLVAVRSDLPHTQIHATEIDAQGVARMRELENLEIPPGATVTLSPGGMHVMFMGLEAPLTPDTTIPATLVFEKAGEVAVEFTVRPRREGDDMHGMSH